MAEVPNDPWHTAIHETGHAVVGRKLGLDMGQTSIEHDEGSSGPCIIGDPWATLSRWEREDRSYREFRFLIRAQILMLMAGAEAERIVLGFLEEVDGAMERLPGDAADNPRRLAGLRRAAIRLVRRHRGDLKTVAAMLRDRGSVPGPENDAMVPRPLPGLENIEWSALLNAESEGEPIRLTHLVWAVQRSRYMTLESIAPIGDDATVSLPSMVA